MLLEISSFYQDPCQQKGGHEGRGSANTESQRMSYFDGPFIPQIASNESYCFGFPNLCEGCFRGNHCAIDSKEKHLHVVYDRSCRGSAEKG